MAVKKIEKKTWPGAFEKIVSGEKTFDARIDNFDIKKGDLLVLKEWDPKTKKYTGRTLEKKVTFVLKTKTSKFWEKEDLKKYGLQIISFKN
jgi:ribosomal protein S17